MSTNDPEKPTASEADKFFDMLNMYSDRETGEAVDKPTVPISQETSDWLRGISKPPLDDAEQGKDVLTLTEIEAATETTETETGRTVRWSRHGSEDS